MNLNLFKCKKTEVRYIGEVCFKIISYNKVALLCFGVKAPVSENFLRLL